MKDRRNDGNEGQGEVGQQPSAAFGREKAASFVLTGREKRTLWMTLEHTRKGVPSLSAYACADGRVWK